MPFHLSKRSLDRMADVDERLQQIAKRAIQITAVDFGIPADGGFRTADEQRILYCAGKSNCDGIVKRSKHQDGLALDVYAYVSGQASWNKLHLSMVACAFLQAASELGYKLEWGGNWKSFQDMPHFQLTSN